MNFAGWQSSGAQQGVIGDQTIRVEDGRLAVNQAWVFGGQVYKVVA